MYSDRVCTQICTQIVCMVVIQDHWKHRAELAESHAAELDAARGSLEKTISEERATMFKAMKEYQVRLHAKGFQKAFTSHIRSHILPSYI